jgi:hypothetical protein
MNTIGGVHYESTIQAVLTSILQTAKQQGKKPFDVLLELLCGRDKHKILDLVPGTREATPDCSRAAKADGRLLPSRPASAVPWELLALHATSPPRGPVSATVQP